MPTFVTFPVQIADQLTFRTQVPFVFRFKSILVSHHVASINGALPVAALLTVISLTADQTSVVGNLINSLLPPSFIER